MREPLGTVICVGASLSRACCCFQVSIPIIIFRSSSLFRCSRRVIPLSHGASQSSRLFKSHSSESSGNSSPVGCMKLTLALMVSVILSHGSTYSPASLIPERKAFRTSSSLGFFIGESLRTRLHSLFCLLAATLFWAESQLTDSESTISCARYSKSSASATGAARKIRDSLSLPSRLAATIYSSEDKGSGLGKKAPRPLARR